MPLPSTGGADPRGSLRIALPPDVVLAVQVYFRQDRAPDPEALERFVLEWIARHARDPLRGAILEHLRRNPWKITVVDVREAPQPLHCHVEALPPEGLFCYRNSRRCLQVGTKDALRPPRPGLWAIFASGRALAEALDGVIFDLLSLGLSYRPAAREIPQDGRIAVVQHINVLQSVNERGLGWTTTTGLTKFGLPNLQIEESPAHLARPLAGILSAVAQRLVGRVLEETAAATEPPARIFLDRSLILHPADIVRATGQGAGRARGSRPATVGLEYTAGIPGGREPFITVRPPDGFRGGPSVWAQVLVDALTGRASDDQIVNVCEHCTHEGALERAHRRAVNELPSVKERFRKGLKPGRVLLVKVPFPHGKGGFEYMWVTVTTWRGIRIQGQLTSHPLHRKDLRAGDPIEIDEMEVYDWMVTKPDGSFLGGYTERVLTEGDFEE